MKILKKVLVGILAGVVVFGSMLSAGAKETPGEQPSVNQDGISVQILSDQESYEKGDTAEVTAIVTNTNNFTVKNVAVQGVLPEGLVLAEGETSVSCKELAPGESVQLQVKVKLPKEDGGTSGGDNGEDPEGGENSPQTGSPENHIMTAIILLLIAGSAVTAGVLVIRKKQWKKGVSLFLCVALLLPALPVIPAFAQETSGQLEASRGLKFGDTEYLYTVQVSYEISDDTTPPPEVEDVEMFHVDLGDSASEAEAALTFEGESSVETVHASVGSLEDDYTVRSLSGEDGRIKMEFPMSSGADATLEFQEIHQRDDAFFAYDIYVNGEKVYTRTYEPLSDGPNHFFVEVGASLLNDSGKNTLEIVSRSENTLRLNQIWIYSDFETVLENEGAYRPMEVSLFTPKLSYEDYEADLEVIRSLQAEYSGYDLYTLGLGFDFLYMHLETKELQERLDYLMRLSVETGIPFHLSVNSWWGGTPHGYDGQGNMWTDIKYNQVVYDPLDVTGMGNWQLSTPNQWSNTPWLTMNNDYYNEVRENRVEEVAEYISTLSAEYRAQGKSVPPMTIFTENEPLYWPYSAFNASPDARADFGVDIIEDAAADGVTLNPEDGISDEERMWMYKNLNRYVAGIGSAMAEGLGHDAIVVDNGEIIYPEYQLVENAYSHMFLQNEDPIPDMNQGMWETHMLEDIRFGGEWAGEQDSRYLDYIAARGRFSDVNAEHGSMDLSNPTLLEQAYAAGSNHVTIYNFVNGDAGYINSADEIANSQVTVNEYARTSGFLSFNSKELTTGGILVGMEDVHTEPLGFQYVLTPSKADGSSVTFLVEDNGAPLEHGLLMKLNGRILSGMNANCRIEVLLGESDDSTEKVMELSEITPSAIDLSPYMDGAMEQVYVKLVLHTDGNPSLYSWTCLKDITFQIPSGLSSGHTSGTEYTYREMRSRNLWVTYRADALRMLEDYEETAGQDSNFQEASALIESGHYVSAYEYLVKVLSETLPAKYTVKGSGTLGKYPVEVKAETEDSIVDITLTEVGESLGFTLSSQAAQTVTMVWKDIKNGKYRLETGADGTYRVAADENGNLTARDHQLELELTSAPHYNKDYPDQFEAVLDSVNGGYLNIQSHNAAIGECVNSVALKLAENAIIVRGEYGADDSQYAKVPASALLQGDKLELTLNDADEVVAVRASYGRMQGTVVSVEYPKIKGEASNAFITIKDEKGDEHRFELGSEAVFDYPSRTGSNILTSKLDDYGLPEGEEITVFYTPYNENREEGVYRVLKLTQPYEIILNETFETDSWKDSALEYDNVEPRPLDSNYTYKVLAPASTNSTGSIIWELDNNGLPFGWINVQFSGRSIMGSSLKWFTSTDKETWTQVADYSGPDWQSNTTFVDILLEDVEESKIYVKCEMTCGADYTWSSVNDIQIKKMASDHDVEKAELKTESDTLDQYEELAYSLTLTYDDGIVSDASGAKVTFVSSDPSVISVQGDTLKGVNPGKASVYAVVEYSGKTVVTNTVSITVNKVQQLTGASLSLEKTSVMEGETLPYEVSFTYDGEGTPVEDSQVAFSFEFTNPDVVSYKDGKLTTASAGSTEVYVVAQLHGTTVRSEPVAVTVTRIDWTELCKYDYEDLEEFSTEVPGVYSSNNIRIEKIEPGVGFNEQGICALPDPETTPDWDARVQGDVVYKLTAPEGAFEHLKIEYSGRAIMGGDMILSISENAEDWQQASVMTNDEIHYNTIRTLNLSEYAAGKSEIYVKFTFNPTRFTWCWLNSFAAFSGKTSGEA